MNSTLTRWIIGGFVIISGFLLWSYFYSGRINFFGAVAAPDSGVSLSGLALGYSATLVGVFMGAGYRQLSDGTTPEGEVQSVKTMLSSVGRSKDFWAGLFASPLVFGVLFKTTDGIGLSGLIVIALENGFFCHFVVQQLMKERT